MNRRHFLRLTAVTGVMAGAWMAFRGDRGELTSTLLAATADERKLLTAPRKVPRDFVGMHFHRWPEGDPLSPAPTYRFGSVRSHDYAGPRGNGIRWSSIHLGPDHFDWSALDTWVSVNASQGKTLLFTVYGTPTWASSSPTRNDLYGTPGGNAPPTSLKFLEVFIRALVERYNKQGRRQIQWIETWNEPHFHQDGGFWRASASKLAAMGRTIYQAAKACDPGIQILSPALDRFGTGDWNELTFPIENALFEYLTASDGLGGTGAQWCDALAVHTYEASIVDPSHGIEDRLRRIHLVLQKLHLTLPIYNTEIGYEQKLGPFFNGTPPARSTILKRQAAVQAALGVQAMYFYSHDDEFVGDPSVNPEIAQAFTDISTNLADTTLRQVSILAGGVVRLVTDRRTFDW